MIRNAFVAAPALRTTSLFSSPLSSTSTPTLPSFSAPPPRRCAMSTAPALTRLPSGSSLYNRVLHTAPLTGTGADTSAQAASILDTLDAELSTVSSDRSRVLSVTCYLSPSADAAAASAALSSLPVPAMFVPAVNSSSLLSVSVTAAAGNAHPDGVVSTKDAAQAVGPYNQAVVTDAGTVYVSGCIGLTADTGEMAGDTVASQGAQAFSNLRNILAAAGCGPKDVVKTLVLLDDMKDFAEVNAMYADFFDGVRVPARSCFAAKTLPKGAVVEIEAIAIVP